MHRRGSLDRATRRLASPLMHWVFQLRLMRSPKISQVQERSIVPGTASFLLARRPGRISSFRVAVTSRAEPLSFRSAFARSLVRSRVNALFLGNKREDIGYPSAIHNRFFTITIIIILLTFNLVVYRSLSLSFCFSLFAKYPKSDRSSRYESIVRKRERSFQH